MTFEDLKAEILSRVKRLEICNGYHPALLSTNKVELLQAGIEGIRWVYRSGVVDDLLLSEFTEEELNVIGVYAQSSSITNPVGDIYLLNGTFDILIDGNNTANIYVLSGTANVNIEGTAYAKIKYYGNSDGTMDLSDNATACVEATKSSNLTIYTANDSVLHLTLSDDATITLSSSGNSYSLIKGFNNSTGTYEIADLAEVEVKLYNNSSISEGSGL